MDSVTLDCYNTQAATYAARYEAADLSSLHRLLLRHLPDRCRVLELGCGSGRDAAFLHAHGYAVTATDASPSMLTLAAQLHPELTPHLHLLSFPTTGEQTVCPQRPSKAFQILTRSHEATKGIPLNPFPLRISAPSRENLLSPLPTAHCPLPTGFPALLSVAMLMHIPDQELFECATQMRDLLTDDGLLVLQLSLGRGGLSQGRDDAGRLYNERPPEEVQLLFERLGFRLIAREDSPDFMNRDIQWYTLVLQRATGKMARSVDEIETIITRDKKDATYKLALLRALCDIAQYEPHMAKWRPDGTVSVPLGLVAEKWLLYYWPIIELDLALGRVAIPQKRGLEVNKPIAFRRAVRDLAAAYAPHNGLSALYNDYKAGTIPVQCRPLLDMALNTIAKTIVSGPVTYAGGALEGEGSYFGFEGPQSAAHKCLSPQATCDRLGRIIVPGGAWREMSLIGHWVSESIILRWAELTYELSEKQVPVKDVIDRLLIRPVTDRDVQFARKIYASTPDLRCVWTDRPLKKDFAVDHTIPFSISRNNDLWNLLPAAPAVNLAKSDKLVAKTVILKQRDAVIHCWELLQAQSPDRFEVEITRALFHAPFPPNNQQPITNNRGVAAPPNWQLTAFAGLIEQVETLAAQRGLARWAP